MHLSSPSLLSPEGAEGPSAGAGAPRPHRPAPPVPRPWGSAGRRTSSWAGEGGVSSRPLPLGASPAGREAQGSVTAGPRVLKALLRAGLHLQLSLVPPPALAAGARLGTGLAVPVEDGFAFAAPGRNQG